MQFITIASALFAAALAAPTPQTTDCPNPAHCGGSPPTNTENVDVSDFTIRKNNGIQSLSFVINADNATDLVCSTGAVPSLPHEIVNCGDSDYRFGLVASPSNATDPAIALYHQTAPFAGRYAIAESPSTYCHAGGNGPDDFVCSQTGFYTIVIASG